MRVEVIARQTDENVYTLELWGRKWLYIRVMRMKMAIYQSDEDENVYK